MNPTTNQVSHSPGDVSRLAREVMGWELTEDVERIGYAVSGDAAPVAYRSKVDGRLYCANTKGGYLWNPFTDANADVQVLERVRTIWPSNGDRGPGETFKDALPVLAMYYRTGDFARAALAVLDSATPSTNGGPDEV